ncbi:Amino acid transporter AVT1J [Vitis vinifera]|uniref:Amino acid transporter AVT1J n=1 Tax=Vitis vinifera TaxID=29760 RepID=A0A438D7I4_VITVI|nr:Amino acid transporter AVT1J [Vitis vinifera]
MEYSSTGCNLDLGSTSFFKTCFNGLNALLGIGILSVPYALASGGWLSLMLLFVIALATFYTGLLLQRCMDVDLNIRTYPDIATGAFASITILGSILWTGVFDGVGFQGKGTTLNWKGIPTAFSLYALCYCAHPVFPTLYTSMRKKNQFSTVLLVQQWQFWGT